MGVKLPDVMKPSEVAEVLEARQLASEEELMRWFKLTVREADFVLRYVADPTSATTAFRAAFGKAGKSRDGWGSGKALLQDPRVSNAIAHQMLKLMERTHFTKERILNELAVLAFSDVTAFIMNPDGTLGLKEGVPEYALRAVQSVKKRITKKTDEAGNEYEITELEVKLWSKTEALKLAGQHLGLYTTKVDVTGTVEVRHKQVWEFGGREIEFQ